MECLSTIKERARTRHFDEAWFLGMIERFASARIQQENKRKLVHLVPTGIGVASNWVQNSLELGYYFIDETQQQQKINS